MLDARGRRGIAQTKTARPPTHRSSTHLRRSIIGGGRLCSDTLRRPGPGRCSVHFSVRQTRPPTECPPPMLLVGGHPVGPALAGRVVHRSQMVLPRYPVELEPSLVTRSSSMHPRTRGGIPVGCVAIGLPAELEPSLVARFPSIHPRTRGVALIGRSAKCRLRPIPVRDPWSRCTHAGRAEPGSPTPPVSTIPHRDPWSRLLRVDGQRPLRQRPPDFTIPHPVPWSRLLRVGGVTEPRQFRFFQLTSGLAFGVWQGVAR